MKITIAQRRFLILWVLFHSFALFVNVFKISGTIVNESYDAGTYWKSKYVQLFTTGPDEDFWPITEYSSYRKYIPYYRDTPEEVYNFNGIFNSYDFTEYIFYFLIGLGIVFIPKLWQERKAVDNMKNI
ncbi:hypothetical protein [Daejeonella sp. JGW-45]|uniref:hypothetical protein n=1 Tax=Daejeonella sp. JGW-45 TaxID=3034148 RepID=UPI0023EACB4F|nr:hypothetical protein [Daejeonella sp. JGW-45]